METMLTTDIKQQLNNLVRLDREALRALAIKTKRLNQKCESILNLFSEIIDKQHEFRDAETLNEEYRSTLVELSEKEVRLRKQITKMKKKQIEIATIRSDLLYPEDEKVYTKDLFKVNLLNTVTKLRFRVAKSCGQIIVSGYVSKQTELHPFEYELPLTLESKQSIPSLLWDNIKLTSNHIDEWTILFANATSELDNAPQAASTFSLNIYE